MREKLSNFFIVIIFIAMITIPQTISWILEENTNISITENRKLNEKPALKLSTITEYPKKFDDYYNDHLPFRENLRKIWTNINYDLFNATIDDKVIIGKENWLFYNNQDEKPIEQTQGILEFTNKEKENTLKNLIQNKKNLEESNIKFFVLILPNKENVYREYLPDSINIKKEKTRTEELIEYIENNSDISITYPKEELLKAKSKYQVYLKHDTHWNMIGALIGTIEIQKAISKELCFNINDANIIVKNEKDTNDLATMINLQDKLYENKLEVDNFYSDISYTYTFKDKYEIFESNSENNETVLLIGDSFRANMMPYLSKLYKKVAYVKVNNYNQKILQEVKPDIVIFETIERYSSSLRTIKIK